MEQHLIPESLRSLPARLPRRRFSRWQPWVKHEDLTVPRGC